MVTWLVDDIVVRALVARFQHLHPICIGREANVGDKRTTSKLMILVEFLNLAFASEADIT
jgi:hypothetical protein